MLARADYAALEQNWPELWSWLGETDTWQARRNDFLYIRGRALWLQGRLAEAGQVCEQMAGYELYREHRANTLMMRGLLALGQHDLAAAEACYRQAVEVQAETRLTLPGHARLGLAAVYWAGSQRQAALAQLAAGLAEIERRKMPGLALQEGPGLVPLLEAAVRAEIYPDLAQFCLSCLTNKPAAQPLSIPETQERLTGREVEVLKLIGQGASNRTIANQLVISEHTVKSHVTRILAKIGAASRTEAAARARKLGLL
jgi:ATP/maltotriose-dependent transcriptional regulator MalT